MPNIMMFGFEDFDYLEMKKKINRAMEKLGLGADAVTTFVRRSQVQSCDGKCTLRWLQNSIFVVK